MPGGFVYQDRQNPLVGSIGELMLRSGDIAAQRDVNVANAQAAGTVGAATAYGGAIKDIGQIAGTTIAQINDPRRKAEQIQLTEAQDAQRSRNIFEAELRNPANYKADGTVDDAKVADRLRKQDVGAWQQWSTISAANQKNTLDLHEKLQQIAKNDLDIGEKQRQAREVQGKYLGELAFHTEQVLKTGPEDPLHARDTFMASVARGITDGVIAPSEGKAMLMHTAQATPDQLQTLVASAVPLQMRGELEKRVADTALATANARKAGAEADAIAKNGLGTPPAAQAKAFRVKMPGGGTQDVPLEFVPGRSAAQPGAYYLNKPDGTRQQMFPGRDFTEVPLASVTVNANAAAAADNLPSWARDASRPVRGDAAANALDPKIHMTPNGLFQDAQTWIASGQYPPMGRGSDPISVARRSAIDAKVGAIASDAGMDVPTLRAFYKSNAKSLQQLQQSSDSAQAFMATADKNSALLEDTLKKIPDTGSPLFNKPLRAFMKDVAGDTNLAQFGTYLQSVQNEYAKIISNPNLAGQLTDSARQEAQALVKGDATVPQIIGSLKALRAEGSNRLLSLGEQIQRVAGRMNGRTDVPAPGGAPLKVGVFTVTVK